MATNAQVGWIFNIAADSAGNIYFDDSCRVRKLAGGIVTTVAGNGTCGYSGDGGPGIAA